MVIQVAYRKRLEAKREEEAKRKQQEYLAEMDRLEREAYVQFAKMQREEQEMRYQKQLEKKREEKERMKREAMLRDAAFDGEVDQVVELLGTFDLNVDTPDAHGDTALSEAASGGCTEVISCLLERGANVNARGRFDRTPLYRACFSGHAEAVKLLLKHGADPRLYDSSGERPVDISSNADATLFMESWDVAATDRMLATIEAAQQEKRDRERAQRASATQSMEDKVRQTQARHELAQKQLRKAYALREKRYVEYDEVAIINHREKMAVAEKMIKDAEAELAEAKCKADEAQRANQKMKQAARELEFANRQEDPEEEDPVQWQRCNIRELDEVVIRDTSHMLSKDGRWPLLIDMSRQVATFLRYRDTNFVNICNPSQMEPERLRLAVLGSIRYGKPLVLDMMDVDAWPAVEEQFAAIEPDLLDAILSKDIVQDQRYESLIREEDGEAYRPVLFVPSRMENFCLYVVTTLRYPDPDLCERLMPIEVMPSGAA